MTNDLESEFYSVLDGALESRKMRGAEGPDYLITEILPGVFELVMEPGEGEFENFYEVLLAAGAAHLIQGYLQTEWCRLKDGRFSCCLMTK